MKLKLTARALIAIALGAATLTPLAAQAAESGRAGPKAPGIEVSSERSIAAFEGKTLDLSKSWGDARACWVDDDFGTTCYRTEAAMDKALEKAGKLEVRPTAVSEAEGARLLSCSSSLRLYSNNYYSGYALYLTSRWSWINMSWFGFDNVVSSYRVGACSATFRSGSYGGGTTYWGNTSQWAQRSTMTGWNNVLSSVYIV